MIYDVYVRIWLVLPGSLVEGLHERSQIWRCKLSQVKSIILLVQNIQVQVAYQAYSIVMHNNHLWWVWKGVIGASWLLRQVVAWEGLNTTVHICLSEVDYPHSTNYPSTCRIQLLLHNKAQQSSMMGMEGSSWRLRASSPSGHTEKA